MWHRKPPSTDTPGVDPIAISAALGAEKRVEVPECLLRPAKESCTMQEQHPQNTSQILLSFISFTSMAAYLIRNLPAWYSRTSPYCYLSRFGEPCIIAGSNAQCVPKLRTQVLITKKSKHSAPIESNRTRLIKCSWHPAR